MDASNTDELYSAEGTSPEEWKRIYDLRYCTILIPFESEDFDAEHPKAKQSNGLAAQTKQGWQQDQEEHNKKEDVSKSMSLNVTNGTTSENIHVVHLATPRATPARPVSKELRSSDATPTPQTKKKEFDHTDDQDGDMTIDDHCGLTESDPLSKYLAMRTNQRTSSTKKKNSNLNMSEEEDDTDMESFHDAVSGPESDEATSYSQSHMHCRDDYNVDPVSSSRSGIKRQRVWEPTSSQRLLQPIDPHPAKRIALSPSISSLHGTKINTSNGLLQPRSFSPSLSPSPSIWITPVITQNIDDSTTASKSRPDTPSKYPCVTNAPTLWKKQDWKLLEELYDELNGADMEESELGQVVDQFLTKKETTSGGSHKWSREFVLLRCTALHRVRIQGASDSASQEIHLTTTISKPNSWRGSSGFGKLNGIARRSVSPYPVGLMRRAGSTSVKSLDPGASGYISNFVDERRADRARQQRSTDQGYHIKSVFKLRLAAGLKTVGELLPFWKDVEKGHTDIKEKIAVPLVPAGKAHSVIAAFESQAVQVRHDVPARSRSGSVLSYSGSWNSDGSSPPSSIAELISRGHATRVASISSATSTSTSQNVDSDI